ncbi:MAG TPA: SMP-30/gluconolactonase/LRE family protein [Frankiaceae bacterium]|nr:SMP-30/gluconolactonase/LRE family protein [Frankiaceae bacterium]
MDGIVFGESPRWRDGRVWFSDWAQGRVYSVAGDGSSTIEAEVASFPLCIDFLPDGRLLLVSSADRKLLRREADGSLVQHADLAPISLKPWNDIVVDGRGNAYVNSIGFDFPGGDFAPGIVVLAAPDGAVIPVAEGLAFPNGMAVTPDNSTLIVAESYAEQLTAYDIANDGTLGNRRAWAPTPGDHPDGICLDTDGAVWYADVGNRRCVRVREGGAILATVAFNRGAFACALSRGSEPQLYVVGQDWAGPDAVGGATGQLVGYPAPAAGAGFP